MVYYDFVATKLFILLTKVKLLTNFIQHVGLAQ